MAVKARVRLPEQHKQMLHIHSPAHCEAPLLKPCASRRTFLYVLLGTGGGMLLPQVAQAYDFPMLGSFLQPVAPTPVKFPRRSLDMRFAVLLMRSSYDAADSLDFVPMDEFQKDFWKLRASEQEPYLNMYSPIRPRVGDLTDPLYFDFISFSQYAVISRDIQKGRKIFKEYCAECDGGFQVVQRALSLPESNSGLADAFFITTGDSIYTGLVQGFREKQFNAPPPVPPSAPISKVLDQLQGVLQVMVEQGYAIKAEVGQPVVNDDGQIKFRVSVQGPANLWGLAALSSRQSLVLNAFDAMVTGAFLRACGRKASFNISIDETGFQEDWMVA